MSEFKHSIKVPTQYRVTAKILRTALEKQQSVNSLIFEEKHARIRSLKAVLTRYSKNRAAVDKAIEVTGLLKENPNLDSSLAKVLVTELILGRGELTGESKPVQTVRLFKEKLQKALDGSVIKNEVPHPRYVRINTNLLSIAGALEYLASNGWRRKELPAEASYADFLAAVRALQEDEFMTDINVETVLVFHSKQAHYWAVNKLVRDRKFILQNKATCLAAELLAPPPGSTVLDLCAAPGMKTQHLCNVMQNKGRIYAVEQDFGRYNTMRDLSSESGCNIVKHVCADAFTISHKILPDVEYILVDPSCSGSGMQRRINVGDEGGKDVIRLAKLSSYQSCVLAHAMSSCFPDVKRILYCTCSLNTEENEKVVQRCLYNKRFKLLSCKKALRNKWHNTGDKEFEGIGKNCLYCLPDHDLTDGIFYALFERIKDD